MARKVNEQEIRVARLDELEDPGCCAFENGDGDWPFRGVVVRWQGEVHAYANICPHQGHPLNIEADGFFSPDRTQLMCVSHGALFEPATGLCTFGPCAGAQMQRLECRVEKGAVWVQAPASMPGA